MMPALSQDFRVDAAGRGGGLRWTGLSLRETLALCTDRSARLWPGRRSGARQSLVTRGLDGA